MSTALKSLLVIAFVATSFNGASAFSVSGSMGSAFGGSILITETAAPKIVNQSSGATIEMRKGKDNVPPAMRAQYKKQKEMAGMREQMMEAQRPGADGLPVFNLFVRTPRANVRNNMSCIIGICFICCECFCFSSYFSIILLCIDVVPMWIIQGR